MRTLVFVASWYGPDVTGGAETLCRRTAEALAAAGLRVEVLTTCARDYTADWDVNYHREGVEEIGGIPVRRFAVRRRDARAFAAVNARLLQGRAVTPAEERVFVREIIGSDRLCEHLRDRRDEAVFLFTPYMFGTTYWGSAVAPDRSVIIPCLHDEPYAHLAVVREMFARVRGVACLSRAELALAERLYALRPGAAALVGGAVDTHRAAVGERFLARHGRREFLLYAGRKEPGKNVPLLLDYFGRYRRARGDDLALVLIGPGRADVPAELGGAVLDLGFVPAQEKLDAYAAALALVQPSCNESYSIVMMEAWAAGTPVIAHAGCAVTRDHCREGQGGLFFADYAEFAAILDRLRAEPALRRALGKQGQAYVEAHHTWEALVDRYERALAQWGFPVARPHRSAARRERPAPPAPARGRPRGRVDQLLAAFRLGDAVSHEALALSRAFRAWGYEGGLYADHVHPDSAGLCRPASAFRLSADGPRLVVYHYSIHTPATELFLAARGRKVLRYHNITPARYFEGYSPTLALMARLGRERLPEIAMAADLALGDSRYNCDELERCAAAEARVLPFLLDLEGLARTAPDPAVLARFGDGRPMLLSVGRLTPNKRQEDAIEVLATYRRAFDATAQLVLVGSGAEAPAYEAELRARARAAGAAGAVTLAGVVDQAALVAYYRTAAVFLSMSEHEGFCVPLLEAMRFDLPVVAYAAAAVPDTLGGAGILVRDKRAPAIAATIHRLRTDRTFREAVVARQRRRLRDFAPAKVLGMLRLFLAEAGAT
jgi:glycosyltransferase involved in cell wall biosynthesis